MINSADDALLVTLEEIEAVAARLKRDSMLIRTPLVQHVQHSIAALKNTVGWNVFVNVVLLLLVIVTAQLLLLMVVIVIIIIIRNQRLPSFYKR